MCWRGRRIGAGGGRTRGGRGLQIWEGGGAGVPLTNYRLSQLLASYI